MGCFICVCLGIKVDYNPGGIIPTPPALVKFPLWCLFAAMPSSPLLMCSIAAQFGAQMVRNCCQIHAILILDYTHTRLENVVRP